MPSIATAEGWYLLAVKDGETNLQRDFAYLDRTGTIAHDRHETAERGHGRIERLTCTIIGDPHGILDEIDPDQRWAGLGCAVRVVAERTVRGRTFGPWHPVTGLNRAGDVRAAPNIRNWPSPTTEPLQAGKHSPAPPD